MASSASKGFILAKAPSLSLLMRQTSQAPMKPRIWYQPALGMASSASKGFILAKAPSLPGQCAISGKTQPSDASMAMRPCMSSASRKILSEPSPSSPTHHAPGAYFEKPSGSKPTSPTSEPSSGVVVHGSATDGYCAPLDDRFWAFGAALAPFLPKPKPAAGAARQSATTSFILNTLCIH